MAAGARPAKYHGGLFGSMYSLMTTPQTVRTTNPGKFHKKNASNPPSGPARANATEMTNWVLEGPGRPWNKNEEKLGYNCSGVSILRRHCTANGA